jgi:hypothetical protein
MRLELDSDKGGINMSLKDGKETPLFFCSFTKYAGSIE